MAIANVSLNDTFFEWMTTTNQVIVSLDQNDTLTYAVYDQANTAYGQGNTAYNQANTAYNQANAAYDQANTANDNIATVETIGIAAFAKGNTACTNADTAQTIGIAAFAKGNTACTKADTAQTVAVAAFAKGNTACTKADTAQTGADTAQIIGVAAFFRGNTAQTVAVSAFAKANAALPNTTTTLGGSLTVAGTLTASANVIASKIGVGTSSPSTTFHVNGDTTFGGSISEKVYNLTGTAIDPSNGTIQYKIIGSNTTLTESLSEGESVILMLQSSSPNDIVSWPTTIWVNNAKTAPTTITGDWTVVALWKVAGSLYGALVGDGT
jgi:hypothetical protein